MPTSWPPPAGLPASPAGPAKPDPMPAGNPPALSSISPAYAIQLKDLKARYGDMDAWPQIEQALMQTPDPAFLDQLTAALGTLVKLHKGQNRLSRVLYRVASMINPPNYRPKDCDSRSIEFVLNNRRLDGSLDEGLIEALQPLQPIFREEEKQTPKPLQPASEAPAFSEENESDFQALSFYALQQNREPSLLGQDKTPRAPDPAAIAQFMLELHQQRVDISADLIRWVSSSSLRLFIPLQQVLKTAVSKFQAYLNEQALKEPYSPRLRHPKALCEIEMVGVLRLFLPFAPQEPAILETLEALALENDPQQRERRLVLLLTDPSTAHPLATRFDLNQPLEKWAESWIRPKDRPAYQRAVALLQEKQAFNAATLGLLCNRPEIAEESAQALVANRGLNTPEVATLAWKIMTYRYFNEVRETYKAPREGDLARYLKLSPKRLGNPTPIDAFIKAKSLQLQKAQSQQLHPASPEATRFFEEGLEQAGAQALAFAALWTRNGDAIHQKELLHKSVIATVVHALCQPDYMQPPLKNTALREALQYAIDSVETRDSAQFLSAVDAWLAAPATQEGSHWFKVIVTALRQDASAFNAEASIADNTLQYVGAHQIAPIREALEMLMFNNKLSWETAATLLLFPEFAVEIASKFSHSDGPELARLIKKTELALTSEGRLQRLSVELGVQKPQGLSALSRQKRKGLRAVVPLPNEVLLTVQQALASSSKTLLTTAETQALGETLQQQFLQQRRTARQNLSPPLSSSEKKALLATLYPAINALMQPKFEKNWPQTLGRKFPAFNHLIFAAFPLPASQPLSEASQKHFLALLASLIHPVEIDGKSATEISNLYDALISLPKSIYYRRFFDTPNPTLFPPPLRNAICRTGTHAAAFIDTFFELPANVSEELLSPSADGSNEARMAQMVDIFLHEIAQHGLSHYQGRTTAVTAAIQQQETTLRKDFAASLHKTVQQFYWLSGYESLVSLDHLQPNSKGIFAIGQRSFIKIGRKSYEVQALNANDVQQVVKPHRPLTMYRADVSLQGVAADKRHIYPINGYEYIAFDGDVYAVRANSHFPNSWDIVDLKQLGTPTGLRVIRKSADAPRWKLVQPTVTVCRLPTGEWQVLEAQVSKWQKGAHLSPAQRYTALLDAALMNYMYQHDLEHLNRITPQAGYEEPWQLDETLLKNLHSQLLIADPQDQQRWAYYSEKNILVGKKNGIVCTIVRNEKAQQIAVIFGGTTAGKNSGSLAERHISNAQLTAQQWQNNINRVWRGPQSNVEAATMIGKLLVPLASKPYTISFLGHSKGAEEAVFAGLTYDAIGASVAQAATHARTTCFSSLGFNKSALNAAKQIADRHPQPVALFNKITHYLIRRDPLNFANRAMKAVLLGHIVKIDPGSVANSVERHDQAMRLLQEEIQRYRSEPIERWNITPLPTNRPPPTSPNSTQPPKAKAEIAATESAEEAQQIIIQIENDPVTLESAWNLYYKNPKRRTLVQLDPIENRYQILASQGRPGSERAAPWVAEHLKIQIVGHNHTQTGAPPLLGAAPPKQVAQSVDRFLKQEGLPGLHRVAKISLVVCEGHAFESAFRKSSTVGEPPLFSAPTTPVEVTSAGQKIRPAEGADALRTLGDPPVTERFIPDPAPISRLSLALPTEEKGRLGESSPTEGADPTEEFDQTAAWKGLLPAEETAATWEVPQTRQPSLTDALAPAKPSPLSAAGAPFNSENPSVTNQTEVQLQLALLNAERRQHHQQELLRSLLPLETAVAHWEPLTDTVTTGNDGRFYVDIQSPRAPNQRLRLSTRNPAILELKATAAPLAVSNSIHSLNLYGWIQMLRQRASDAGREPTRPLHNVEGTDPLQQTLEIQRNVGYAQIGIGFAEDALHFAKNSWNSQYRWNSLSRIGGLTAAEHTLSVLNLIANVANLGLDSAALYHAKNEAQRIVFGTRVGFDSAYLSVSAAGFAGVEAAGPLGIVLLGLDVGITGLLDAFMPIAASADAIGAYFSSLEDAYTTQTTAQSGGYIYDPETQWLKPLPHALIQVLDLQKGRVEFGSQWLYAARQGPTCAKTIGYCFWAGDKPKRIDDKRQAFNIRDGLKIGAHAPLPPESQKVNQVLLSPEPDAYLAYRYEMLPFATQRASLNTLRKLNSARFKAAFYVFPAEYAVYQIHFHYQASTRIVKLGRENRRLEIAQQPPEKHGYTTFQLEADSGEHVVRVRQGVPLILKTANPAQTLWTLDASTLDNDRIQLQLDTQKIIVGDVPISLDTRHVGSLRVLTKDAEIRQIDLATARITTLVVDAARWSNTDETLHRQALQSHLDTLERQHLLPTYIQIKNYRVPAAPAGETLTVYYEAAQRRYLYISDYKAYADAELAAQFGDTAYFYVPSHDCLLQVDANTHQIQAKITAASREKLQIVQETGQLKLTLADPASEHRFEYGLIDGTLYLQRIVGDETLIRRLEACERWPDLEALLAPHCAKLRYTPTEKPPKTANLSVLNPVRLESALSTKRLWLQPRDGTIIQTDLEPAPVDLHLLCAMPSIDQRQVFYFYSPGQQQLYRQEGLPKAPHYRAATRVEFPSALQNAQWVQGVLSAILQTGEIYQIGINGERLLVAASSRWLQAHPIWWRDFAVLAQQNNVPKESLLSLLDLKTSDNKPLAVWFSGGKFIVSATAAAKSLRLLGLNPDKNPDKNSDQSQAWLLEDNGTLYSQPLLDEEALSRAFSTNALKVNATASIPAAEPVEKYQSVNVAGDTIAFNLGDNASTIPLISGYKTLIVASDTRSVPYRLSRAAWAHYDHFIIDHQTDQTAHQQRFTLQLEIDAFSRLRAEPKHDDLQFIDAITSKSLTIRDALKPDKQHVEVAFLSSETRLSHSAPLASFLGPAAYLKTASPAAAPSSSGEANRWVANPAPQTPIDEEIRLGFDSAIPQHVVDASIGSERSDSSPSGLADSFSTVYFKDAYSIGYYVNDVRRAYETQHAQQSGGYRYDPINAVLTPVPEASFKTIDLVAATAEWVPLKFYPTEKGTFGSRPSFRKDKQRLIDVSKKWGIRTTASLPVDANQAKTLVLPTMPAVNAMGEHGVLVGSRLRHDRGFDDLRQLEDENFVYNFYDWLTYIINRLWLHYEPLTVDVKLGSGPCRIELPALAHAKYGYLHFNLQAKSGQFELRLRAGVTFTLHAALPTQTVWILDGRELGSDAIHFNGLTLTVGGATVHFQQAAQNSRVRLMTSEAELHIDLIQRRAIPFAIDATRWNTEAALTAHLRQLALQKTLPPYIRITHAPLNHQHGSPRSTVWYETARERYLHVDNSHAHLTTELAAQQRDRVYFYTQNRESVLEVDANTHQILERYRCEDSSSLRLWQKDEHLILTSLNRSFTADYRLEGDTLTLERIDGSADLVQNLPTLANARDFSEKFRAYANSPPANAGNFSEKFRAYINNLYAVRNGVKRTATVPSQDRFLRIDTADTRYWFRARDATVLQTPVRSIAADLDFISSHQRVHQPEIFYFYSASEQKLYRQEGTETHLSAVQLIDAPATFQHVRVVRDRLYATTQNGETYAIDPYGQQTLTAVNATWLRSHPVWWETLKNVSYDTRLTLQDLKGADGKTVAAWLYNRKVVISAIAPADTLKLLGLTLDKRNAWIATDRGELYQQPLMDDLTLAQAFSSNPQQLESAVSLSTAQPQGTFKTLERTGHSMTVFIGAQRLKLPVMRGVSQLNLISNGDSASYTLSQQALEHYQDIVIDHTPGSHSDRWSLTVAQPFDEWAKLAVERHQNDLYVVDPIRKRSLRFIELFSGTRKTYTLEFRTANTPVSKLDLQHFLPLFGPSNLARDDTYRPPILKNPSLSVENKKASQTISAANPNEALLINALTTQIAASEPTLAANPLVPSLNPIPLLTASL